MLIFTLKIILITIITDNGIVSIQYGIQKKAYLLGFDSVGIKSITYLKQKSRINIAVIIAHLDLIEFCLKIINKRVNCQEVLKSLLKPI